ncbi:MAG TPA: hypothetical protein VJ160_07605 [Anaerolineales bacterium]|nr:hypothetical protein [Anaerolineales bacterium]
MSSAFQDRKNVTAAGIALAVWVLFTIAYLVAPLGDAGRPWISDGATLASSWSTAVLAFLLWKGYDPREPAKRIWLALMIGFALWSVGETIWAYYDILLGAEVPFPSIADLAWAVGYLPLWIALFMRYRSIGVRGGRGFWAALAVVGLIGVLVLRYILWPIVTYPGSERLIEKFLTVLYPVGDLILLLLAVMVSIALRGGRLSSAWQLIAAGMAVLGAADLLFVYADWNEIYITEGSPNLITFLADVPYVGAYLIIAVGEYVQARLEETV